jgi:hypothetical protein
MNFAYMDGWMVGTNLLRRGYPPIVYSPQLGPLARELRDATVPVIDNLDVLSTPPDLIHGQHHVETMAPLIRIPNTPAVFFCHGWLPWEETPPKHPRILRFVALDDTCRDPTRMRERRAGRTCFSHTQFS